MNKLDSRCVYKAFGLAILSDIPLPELITMEGECQSIDVSIEEGDLSDSWIMLQEHQQKILVNRNYVMFEIPHVAIFLIKNGRQITVSPANESDVDEIRLFILGTCMGVILMQRHILPLHGSAIVIDNQALAIVGNQGAGKSTLAATFLEKGHKILTDDVIPIIWKGNVPFVIPSYPQQKLWDSSLKEFNMNPSHYKPLFRREVKYAIPVTPHFHTTPLPLAGIVELVKDTQEAISFKSIEGLEGLHTLYRHTYRNFLIRRLGKVDWHFKMTTQLMNHVCLYKLMRPSSTFTAYELTNKITESIIGGNEDGTNNRLIYEL